MYREVTTRLVWLCYVVQADVDLTFASGGEEKKEDPYRYSKKPEIKVLFLVM